MSRAVDAETLAALQGAGLTVAVDEVPTDDDGKTVLLDVPYVALYSNLGDPANRDLAGRPKSNVVEFQVTYVGITRNQAKWAGEKARTALSARLGVFARPRVVESQRVRKDDDARVLVGGSYVPLFYGVDIYQTA